jgi:tRNA pseudouridine38-40 synthase
MNRTPSTSTQSALTPLHRPSRRTIRLIMEYDGSDFDGWQIQAHGRTVQGETARALESLFQEPIIPISSGRTDAGTHATGQVVHFHTDSLYPTERIQRALNGLLPPDIAIHQVADAPSDFHARYGALSKRYRYRICTGKSAIERHHVWSFYRCLDLHALTAATRFLPGNHNFSAFCKQDPVPENFTCHIIDANWARQGDELVFEIEANRFLRHMVRILVGTLSEIGHGRQNPDYLADLLRGRPRSDAGPTAPAQGLCLLWVNY